MVLVDIARPPCSMRCSFRPRARLKKRESQYKESLASCEYAVREHQATFGPKDNEKSFARDHKKPDLKETGKYYEPTRARCIELCLLLFRMKRRWRSQITHKSTHKAWRTTTLSFSSAAASVAIQPQDPCSLQHKPSSPEEEAWNTVKKYLPTALTLGAGAGLGVLGEGMEPARQENQNLNELLCGTCTEPSTGPREKR